MTAAVLIILAVYWATLLSAVRVWANSNTYGFGFLIAPVSLYFIWLRRGEIAGCRARPLLPAFLLFVPLGLLWIISDAADVALGRQLALVGMLQALVLSVLGWPTYKALLFPLQYLWLMVPAGDFLVPRLQEATTKLTVAGLNLLGVPSQHEGILIVAAGSTYRIVEECAALDFLLGALVFSLVYAQLIYQRAFSRVAFVASALVAAVLANLFRTTSIVFLTHITDDQINLARDHQLYGWLVFSLTVVALFAVGLRLRKDGPTQIASDSSRRWLVGAPAGQRPLLLACLAAVLLASLTPTYASYAAARRLPIDSTALCPPAAVDVWQRSQSGGDWQPVFPAADLQLSQRYRGHAGDDIDVFVAYYWSQRPGAELISWQNRISGGQGWQWLSGTSREIEIEGHVTTVTETRLRLGDRRRLVWHWYWVDGHLTSNRIVAKLLQAKATLLTGEPRSAFIALSTEEAEGTAEARRVLDSLIAEKLPLSLLLKSTRAGSC